MAFALEELSEIYPPEEIKAMIYWLFEEYLGFGRVEYLLNIDKGMSESELLKFNFAIKDLKSGKPLQHIIGYTWFLGLKLFVNDHTLIPRPETEELVQYIISNEKSFQDLKILDIGTGTACIPISLGHSMPQHEYHAIDFKTEIIELAVKNSEANQIPIKIIKLDILKDDLECIYDVIISNPPYVLESEKKAMHKNVLYFEPKSALYVEDSSPIVFYLRIIKLAEKHLKPGGRLYFEINENFGLELSKSLKEKGFSSIQIIKDFRGKDRFIKTKKSY